MMVLPLLLVRAQKQLDAFCRQRNAQTDYAEGIFHCSREGERTLLLGRRLPGQNAAVGDRQVLLRLILDGLKWKLYWPRANGEWEPYAQLPVATDINDIITELEQAPLHVHW